MRIYHFIATVLCVLSAAGPARTATLLMERYQINAQYSDPSAQKKFSSLGEATVTCTTKGTTEFNVRLLANVKDPRDGRLYVFDIDSDYVASGKQISSGRSRSKFNEAAQEYRSKVEAVVPFIYLVKFQPLGEHGTDRSYRFRGTDYVVRYAVTEVQVEASLYEDQSLIGKFFLKKSRADGVGVFDKFRVPTAGKVALTFVRLY